MQTVICGNCGGKVKLPAGFAKAKIRCGNCGYYADVPPDQRSAAQPDDDATPFPPPKPPTKFAPQPPPPKRGAPPPPPSDHAPRKPKPVKPIQVRPRTDPRDTRPEFVGDEAAGPPLLEGTQEEDDNPYTVHGSGLKTCPECRGELPLDATFCVHCGEHITAAERDRPKKKRTYTEIDESFGEGWPLPTRLTVFAAALFLNVVFVVVGLAANDWKVDAVSVGTGGVVALVQSALQAFILGTYDTLSVYRSDRGQCTLTRYRRVAFVPLKGMKIKWKKSVGVGRVATHAGSVLAWATCIYLFLCAACLPGILFWWFVLKPDRYDVVLCDLYGGIEETVFRAKGQDEAEKVAAVVAEATTLQLRNVL